MYSLLEPESLLNVGCRLVELPADRGHAFVGHANGGALHRDRCHSAASGVADSCCDATHAWDALFMIGAESTFPNGSKIFSVGACGGDR